MTESGAPHQRNGTRAFALVAAGAVLTSALPARAAEPVSVPADAFAAADAPRSRPDPIAVRGGLLLFGVAYAPMLGVAAAQGSEARKGDPTGFVSDDKGTRLQNHALCASSWRVGAWAG